MVHLRYEGMGETKMTPRFGARATERWLEVKKTADRVDLGKMKILLGYVLTK